jgi:hypothetical protein
MGLEYAPELARGLGAEVTRYHVANNAVGPNVFEIHEVIQGAEEDRLGSDRGICYSYGTRLIPNW